MMRASRQTVGARASDRPRLRPQRATGRFVGHVVLVACWMLVVLMGVLTWGPHATRYRTDVIVGRSMEPAIPLHSVIVVEPVDPADIRRGDVISYQQPDEPDRKVTHRVMAVTGDARTPAFVTKGDGNDVRDPYEVTYADAGYRVRTHVPHVGWLMIHAQTRWARVLLVALPVLLLLAQFLRWVWRDAEETVDDDDSPWSFDEDMLDLGREPDRRGLVA